MENYKKLAQKMNEKVKSSTYDNQHMIKIEHTAFNQLHRVSSGRNGTSRMLDLQTVLSEASAVYFETESRSYGIDVYFDSQVSLGNGESKNTFMRIKDAKGKYHSLSIGSSKDQKEHLIRILGLDAILSLHFKEYADFVEYHTPEYLKAFDNEDREKNPGWVNDTILSKSSLDFAIKLIDDLFYDIQYSDGEKFKKFLASLNCSLVRMYNYVQKFRIYNSKFLNVNSNSIYIGWNNTSTYNTLPETLKISLMKEIKSVQLKDLEIETPGYYSHDDHMTISCDQVDKAKEFAKKFSRAQSKGMNKILKSA